MKEELFEPLVCSDKVEMLPNEQYFYNEADVRSAVMGLYHAIGQIEKHESIQEDSNLGAFTAVVIREELRDWFPVFFDEVEDIDLCPHELSDCDVCEGGAE